MKKAAFAASVEQTTVCKLGVLYRVIQDST